MKRNIALYHYLLLQPSLILYYSRELLFTPRTPDQRHLHTLLIIAHTLSLHKHRTDLSHRMPRLSSSFLNLF